MAKVILRITEFLSDFQCGFTPDLMIDVSNRIGHPDNVICSIAIYPDYAILYSECDQNFRYVGTARIAF